MNNPYIEYYKEQAGSGLSGFQGVRYQRGSGFFGRLLSSAVYPLLRFLGKQALNTGINIASDVIEDKQDFKQSLKNRFKETGDMALKAGLDRARRFQQEGSGRKRRRSKSIKRKTTKTKNSRKKIKKTRRKRKNINFF
jgi:hypothetical protein